MKTIYADFNARTEAGHVCLTTRGSQDDILRLGLRPGDWAWLSDSEIIFGAQLAIDERYGLVGILDRDTLAHLDDEGANDFDRIKAELNPLLSEELHTSEDERRILELLIQFEHAAPPHVRDASPGTLACRRALALRQMGKFGLALVEVKEALRAQADDPEVFSFYLDLLRLEDLPAAVSKARAIAELPDVPAPVLSACISIVATLSEQVPDEQFDLIAQEILALCHRFDHAPNLDQVAPSLVALTYFNRGLVHLRARRMSDARQAFERCQELYPEGPALDELMGLQTYDRHAREVAQRVRSTITEHFPMKPVAA